MKRLFYSLGLGEAGIVAAIFWIFLIGEGVSDLYKLYWYEWPVFLSAFGFITLGFVISWFSPKIGMKLFGLGAVVNFILFTMANWGSDNLWFLWLVFAGPNALAATLFYFYLRASKT